MEYLKQKNPERVYILDIEADSLTPTQIWCLCVCNLKTDEELTFYDAEEWNAWLKENEESIFIGHNAISFDIPTINRLWHSGIDPVSRCIDTLVLSYSYRPALEGGHSLEAWGQRLKFPKGDYNDWSQLTPKMVKYCQQDVRLTKKLYVALSERMSKLGYSELSCLIEHKIRVIIDTQQSNGFYFNKTRAEQFRDKLRQRQADISESIHRLFPPSRTKVAEFTYRRLKDGSATASYERHRDKYGVSNVVHRVEDGIEKYDCYEDIPFNIGSPKQRVERLLALGWKPEKFTPTGFPKVDEDALVQFAESSKRPEIAALAEWLVIQGRASMLDTWFNNLGVDSRIHGRLFTCGASTRRMTHNSPNTANIPSGAKAKYGKECRSFWTVAPGKGLVLVGYDASGLETAGLCHYLNSNAATEVLLRPKPDDIHTANSRRLTEALGREIDREWGAKTSWYAWLYGAYPPKLGSIVKGPASDGDIVIDTFFRNVPGLKRLIDDVQSEWKTSSGRLRTIDGGFVYCPNLNAALNYKIQSLGAILMKFTSIILDEEAKKRGIPFKKVGDIHDEGQLEVEERYADELGKLAVWSIEEAGRQLKLNVSVTGSYLIGKTWEETH